MKRCILGILCIVLFGNRAIHAENNPAYWAVYYFNGSARVVGFNQDKMWTVRDIPNVATGSIVHGASNSPFRPNWSPDGSLLYVTAHTSSTPDSLEALYTYNPTTDTLSTFLGKDKITGCDSDEDKAFNSKAIAIESLSPDGHYALLCSNAPDGNAILDLRTKQLVLTDFDVNDPYNVGTGDCDSSIFAWLLQEHRVMVIKDCGLMNGWSALTTLNTNDWQVVNKKDWPERHWLYPSAWTDSHHGFILGEVVTDDPDGSAIIRVQIETGQVDTLFRGEDLNVSPDYTFATFVDSQHHFMRVNLATLKTQNIGLDNADCTRYGTTSTPERLSLDYVCHESDTNVPSQVGFVAVSSSTVSNTPIGTVSSGSSLTVSDRNFFWAVYDKSTQSIAIHNLKDFDWTTQRAFPDSRVFISPDQQDKLDAMKVGDWRYPWFFVDLVPANKREHYQMAFNVKTNESFLAPNPNWHVFSIAPDSVWFIYADTSQQDKEQLYAFNRNTKMLTLLTEVQPSDLITYGPGSADYFSWSTSVQ